jgi:hypothetical protein
MTTGRNPGDPKGAKPNGAQPNPAQPAAAQGGTQPHAPLQEVPAPEEGAADRRAQAASRPPVDAAALALSLLRKLGADVAAEGRPTFVRIPGRAADSTRSVSFSRRRDVLGWRAPPDCSAVGVVSTGRAYPLADCHEVPPDLLGSLTICCVVCRDGGVGWRSESRNGSVLEKPPQQGVMLDVLRRSLGLSTPPPDRPLGLLHSAAWLTRLTLAGSYGRRLTWREALALHPAVLHFGGPDDPLEAIRSHSSSRDWETYRLAASSDQSGTRRKAAIAAWMDEGSFSRWVLGALPGVEELAAAARAYLLPPAARRFAHLVREVSR